jgi:hypothetical protein
MRDEKPLPADVPAGLQQLQLGETSVRLNPHTGRVRYISGERAWRLDSIIIAVPPPLPESAQALSVVLAALRQLGVPQDEIGPSAVLTQMAAAGALNAGRVERRFTMYRVVTVARQVNGLPVDESRALASVAAGRGIQRLLTTWPPFRLREGLALRSRREVIEEVLNQIMQQSPPRDLTVRARLVYSPQGPDDEVVSYVPAVVVSVSARPTPYLVVVPVAQ